LHDIFCVLRADNNLVDGNADTPKRNLTDWGKKVIWEMNRLGMIADISHVSEGVMVDVLETSKAPVIFSHSSVHALRNHTRNVKDHVLQKLKEKNGVIMINFYSSFIKATSPVTIYDVISERRNTSDNFDDREFFYRPFVQFQTTSITYEI
jgi:microsomal dipeptidase-like Zn-dependent dipeptidase